MLTILVWLSTLLTCPADDIMSSILPEEDVDDIPGAFAQVGHVGTFFPWHAWGTVQLLTAATAHVNLREKYLPYKHIIAQIIKDKNPHVRTVVNKVDDVGRHDEFRTFAFEVLAGDNDTNVIHHEHGCQFRFDFARVYWNSRLEAEHLRLVEKFRPGQLVCDVMAGVGPFAIPTGKKKIFVYANDLNPHGWEAMQDAIKRNKVERFVTAFNMDGRDFIRSTAKALLSQKEFTVPVNSRWRRDTNQVLLSGKHAIIKPPPELFTRPRVPSHYVMNLPASAIDFLDAFQGLYEGEEELAFATSQQRLPMIHTYCFTGSSEDPVDDYNDICKRVSDRIGYTITPEDKANPEIELEIHNVRKVSPKKRMFCISFRLPKQVAFRRR